jgi:hypothetical protein
MFKSCWIFKDNLLPLIELVQDQLIGHYMLAMMNFWVFYFIMNVLIHLHMC